MFKIAELLKFQIVRHANRLSRNSLNFLEDIKGEQEVNIQQLLKKVPEEYHDIILQANVFNEERMERFRKRILDNGGDFTRDMISELENFDMHFKFNIKGSRKEHE